VSLAAARGGGESVLVSGKVECAAGAPVVGVFVEALDGGSGFAEWHARQVPYRAGFTKRLPQGGRWSVSVGCGGTPKRWGSADVAKEVTARLEQDWVCKPPNDPKEIDGTCDKAG
jgi:hypothetical protein